MYEVFYNILYLSIIGSVLGIIILVLRKTFDRKISPTWKFVMWILVMISLIFPFRFTIQSKNSYEFIISSGIDKIELVKENLIANESGSMLIYIWLFVMSAIFIYYIITSIIMKKKIGKEEVKDKRVLTILENCKNKMGIKKEIKLIKQKYKKVPCIYGIFNTKILITGEVLQKDEQSLNYIFMHELAHFKRHDLVINKLLILITTIHWFNPILWFCFKQVRQDMELKADEMVLNNIEKKEEKDYAKTLVKLLPISQEEKRPVKLLCVTDGKKNMERRINMIKLSDKFKEYKTIIGITTLLIVLCIGTFIFTRIEPQEESVTNSVQYFENPDRIVYKEKNTDNYYVFTSGTQDYTDILNEIIKGFDSKENVSTISQEEIEEIEDNENYIELDYDTISKNYVIAYEEKTNNIILRTDTGGQIVKQNLENKDDLSKLIEEKIKNSSVNCYHMEDSEEYSVTNEISSELFESNNSDFRQYEDGVYGVKIQSEEKLNEILERYDIEVEEEITSDVFEKTDIILIISSYNIEKIETRVGGLTYYFTGNKRQDSYVVNIFAASKAINTNCLYRNMDNIFEEEEQENTITSIEKALVTSVEENNITVETTQGESLKVVLNDNSIVFNKRTNENINISNIKVNDKIDFQKIYIEQGEITFTEDTEIFVTRNIHGEELKEELLSGDIEFEMTDVTKEGNDYILTGIIRDLYYCNNYDEAESFEIKVEVNDETTILGVKGNPEEELNQLYKYTIYITFDKDELEKGNLVAENIEGMGC